MKAFFEYVFRELGWRLVGAAAVAIALAMAEGAGLLLLVPLLSSIGLAVNDGVTSSLAQGVTQLFHAVGLQPSLGSVLGVFLVVSAAHALLHRASMLVNPTLEQRVAVSLQNRLYAAMVQAEWAFFISRRNNDLVHALTSQVDRASAAAYQLLTLLTGLAVSSVYVAISFWLSPALTTMVLAAGAVVLSVMHRRNQHSRAMGEQYGEADRRSFHVASESIAGIKVAKSLGAEGRGIRVFDQHARERARAYLDLLRSLARSKLALDIASAILISALLLVAVRWFDVRGADLLLLVFAFARVMPRLTALQSSAEIVAAGVPSFSKVIELIGEAEARPEILGNAATRLHLERGVHLDHVTFSYGGPRHALHDVSLSIPAGRTTAIVGESGAGKSTLADLLLGLLQPSSGRLLIDDRPLDEHSVAGWRQSVGYVPQDSFLLHDTVRANLLWAKPDATEAEMWLALDRAAAAAFLRARPEGLETVVGDRGARLSGGERQRLALARALLTQPEMLVLDEATSALDGPNEQQILAAVAELTGRLTTVIITHRLSAIRGADIIHVLEGGRVVESGSWPELAVRGGAFARLLLAQPHAAQTAPLDDLRYRAG